MKVSLSWLKEFVNVQLESESLAEALTMVGLEVGSLYDRFAYLQSVVVARIEEVKPHPDADRLKLCTVRTGSGDVVVVCGAPNAEMGMLAPLALPGTELPDGRLIADTIIRGVASHGMLCSEVELGLGDQSDGLMKLSPELAVGRSLNDALDLRDMVLEIDLTPNRPDCLSVIGIAREVAAIQKMPLQLPERPAGILSGDIDRLTSVVIEDPDLCPRYAARLIENVTVGPSPRWLQDRLLSVGQRPINNLVDVTNYVMLEMGQPLHAFDFDRLAQNRIVVRRARSGERFTTLDQKDRTLDGEMLMICDGEKPVAIGGVMGGLNSEIEDGTQRVLLESACFNPVSIRRTAKKLGLNTEASHRFERGVDPDGTLAALERAAGLIAELSGGRLVSGIIDACPVPPEVSPIQLSVAGTNRLLGTDLDGGTITGLLGSIGFVVEANSTGADGKRLSIRPPSWRVDVERPEDLMEEVARLYGYGRIPTLNPVIRAEHGARHPIRTLRNQVRRWMTGFGFAEAINYSFIGADACDRLGLEKADPRRRTVRILNPISEAQTVMRTSLVPGLLETLAGNLSQQIRDVRLFEVGKVFIAGEVDQQPEEREMAAVLWSGSRFESGWYAKPEACDFYDIKGVLEALLDGLRSKKPVFAAGDADRSPFLRPGHAAAVSIENCRIGVVGELHIDVLGRYDVKQPAFLFELDLSRLNGLLDDQIQVDPIPRFPGTTRDITLILDRAIESADALRRIEEANEPLVESVHIFDLFEGQPIPDGKKSLSIRVAYRSPEGTLEDEEVNLIHQRLTRGLIEALGAALP